VITIIIGHRGTGKTAFLNRLKGYHSAQNILVSIYDLDAVIEEGEGQLVRKIFEQHGEEYFRRLEKKYFERIFEMVGDQIAYVAVGGGFDVQLIPKQLRTVWIQRVSDRTGRIFFDRPSLEAHLSPLEEFRERARLRKARFQKVAWEEYLVPEGLCQASLTEQNLVFGNIENLRGTLTLLPQNFNSEDGWHYFIRSRLRWGFDYFEIRDDLLSIEQMKKALSSIPKEKLIWARRVASAPTFFDIESVAIVDFDESLFDQSAGNVSFERIVSFHHRLSHESFRDVLEKSIGLEEQGCHIKIAVEVKTFAELKEGHDWQSANPQSRSFLPRSEDGQWHWYRLWVSTAQKLNFIREGEGSSLDQPTLYQWLERKDQGLHFGALLGDPVSHSFTPVHQSDFFRAFRMPVYAINVKRLEFQMAMKVLEQLGLIAAAVTSPLKVLAYEYVFSRTATASEFQSVNTIICDKNTLWYGHNTDLEGLQALIKKADRIGAGIHTGETAVWGGGGTLTLLKKLLPEAQYFSIQTGQNRNTKFDQDWRPRAVVWAGGSLNPEGGQSPPDVWKPQWIIDLNYREDSGGRDYAKRVDAHYLSGETMFYEQAIFQREFWRPFLHSFGEDEKI
jgi:shikimate 5-dehydrogenase/shikimate kinase